MNASKSLSIILVGAALAAGSAVAPAQPRNYAPPANVTFLNGGFGEDEVDAMRSRAREFPLRLMFSEGPRNEFTANVPVTITDARGNTVFALPDAGPMLFVMLPEGRYTVTAESDRIRKVQQVTIGRGRGSDVVFHWDSQATPGNLSP